MSGYRTGRRALGNAVDHLRVTAEAAQGSNTGRRSVLHTLKKRARSVRRSDYSDAHLQFLGQNHGQQQDDDSDADPGDPSSHSAGTPSSTSGQASQSSQGQKYFKTCKNNEVHWRDAIPSLQRHAEDSISAWEREQLTLELNQQASLSRLVAVYAEQPFHQCKGRWSCCNVHQVGILPVHYRSLAHSFSFNITKFHCQTCSRAFETPATVLR